MLGDEAAYRTALSVLRGSARELRTLAPALPSAGAAAAAELADRAIRALPPKAADYAAGESDRRADAQNPLLTYDNADATIAPTEHDDGIDSGVPQDAVEMFQHYDDVRNGFKFLSDERFNQLSIPAKKLGATVIRGVPEWEKRLIDRNATAETIGDIIAFRENVCISEVLEETRHFYQNQIGMNNDKPVSLRILLNEIEAREYIFQNAERFQVPRNEIDFLRKQYENYLKQLNELESE